jgi:hypothetical protein
MAIIRKIRLFAFRVSEYYMMLRLGFVSGRTVSISRFSIFEKDYPKISKILSAINTVVNWFYSKIFDRVLMKYENFMSHYFDGPAKLKVHTMNRRSWYDNDDKIMLTAFSILVDFVEMELPWEAYKFGSISVPFKLKKNKRYPELAVEYMKRNKGSPNHAEILFLYSWWKNVRVVRQDELDLDLVSHDLATRITGSETFALMQLHSRFTEFMLLEDQEMLKRLIDVRGALWV